MTLVRSKVFSTSQACNTIVLAARNTETLSGAKFKPFRDRNCELRRFCLAKPTYSDQEIHKLSNCDKKKFYFTGTLNCKCHNLLCKTADKSRHFLGCFPFAINHHIRKGIPCNAEKEWYRIAPIPCLSWRRGKDVRYRTRVSRSIGFL